MSFEYSKSSYEPRIVKNENGVRILDPNPYQQIVPQEDLFIYVSLIAKQRSKSVLTQVDDNFFNFENRKLSTIDLAVPQEETFEGSKLFKSKSMLSTDWTEIGGHKIDLFKDYEGFNITNIDVKIQSQTAPQIVIDFVDVRGATLFEQGSCSPYGLFFSMPYPIFVLTLKGFYGRPVEYYLNLVKFTTKFNSDTGNMECRGEFIGYSFAFLSDMIMGYIAASQYLKEVDYKPQEYLKKKYLDTVARDGNDINNFCNNPVIGDGRCYTIQDLLKTVNLFDKNTQPEIANSIEVNEVQNLTQLKNSYDSYVTVFNDLVRELDKEAPPPMMSKADFGGSSRPLRYEFKTDEIFKKLITNNGVLLKYFSPETGLLPTNIRITKDKEIKSGVKADAYVDMLTTATSDKFTSTDPNNKCPGCDLYFNKLKDEPWNNIFNLPEAVSAKTTFQMNNIDDNNGVKFIDLGFILKDIEAEQKKLVGYGSGGEGEQMGVITEKKKALIEQINKIVKSKLGFDPTIRNIFTILLCNTDAFMEILLDVAYRAEKHHEERKSDYVKLIQKTGDGNVGLLSGREKVYAWPTYYMMNGGSTKNQGTKEAFPGIDYRFTNWVEVRFVEDFINAFLEWNKDRKIQNGEKEGIAGYDNYVPINPLESPFLNKTAPLKYLDKSDPNEIYQIIGERLFVALDHTLFSPVRLTKDSYMIPTIGKTDNWSTLSNKDDKNNLSKDIGTIEANNILNVYEDPRILSSIISNISKEEFIDKIKTTLNLISKKAIETVNNVSEYGNIRRLIGISNSKLGFSNDDEYYIYVPPAEGILLSSNNDRKVYVKPDPFDMDREFLIQIEDESNVDKDTFEIKLVPEGGTMEQVINIYKTNITTKTKNIDYGTTEFSKEELEFTLDSKQKTTSVEDPRLFTTLTMVSKSNVDGTSWYTGRDLNQLSQSNMGLLSYPDYAGILPGGIGSGTYGISLFGPENEGGNGYKFLFKSNTTLTLGDKAVNLKEGVKLASSGGGGTDDKGVSTAFITTPLWLDNVNKFRGTPLSTGGIQEYTSEKVEKRNLAYLFLQTLKTTPPIIRYVDDDWQLLNSSFTKIHSLKAFNTVAGIVKTPKAWVLNLGAVLWRWKMFVGTKSDGTWNKPLTCIDCGEGDLPTGFDPLSQPGFNSINGTSTNIDRNRIDTYLDKVYSTTGKNWLNQIQKSSFSPTKDPLKGNLPNDLGHKLEGGKLNCYAWFPYFNYLKKIGKLGFTDLENILNDTYDLSKLKSEYSWPMLWISPHHIPYVSPERFYDNETDGTAFVQLFNNSVGNLDYITMMNSKRTKDANGLDESYYESDDYKIIPSTTTTSTPTNTNTVFTVLNTIATVLFGNPTSAAAFAATTTSTLTKDISRNKIDDGNLGMVLQYLPDKVKDYFIEKFETFCDSEEWINLLSVIDPVNFGAQNATLESSYTWDSTISSDILGNSNDTTTLVLKPETTPPLKKLLTDKVYIYNSTPKIWYGITSKKEGPNKNNSSDFFSQFIVSKVNFESYLGALYDTYKTERDKRIAEINKKQTEQKNGLDDSLIEDDDIRLALYRTFKSLTDKWISSRSNGRPFFNVTDSTSSNCGKDFTGNKTLASHFQYVNRVMGDIGSIAMINVTKIRELNNNPKISLYQYISDILTDNEYMFFPLPGYVDFTSQGMSDEDLKDMFRPVLSLKRLSCGPVFLCMYVGGNSRQLKYKASANCPSDLKELQLLEDDGFSSNDVGLPSEMADPKSTGQNAGYTSFNIVYGLENQNHFKNIQLDQAEFSETAESLMVIDKISKQGGTDQTTKGQNLNTVYLTRSYSCQVESLGNMMIQPMTYFDLIGVPMFSGSYLITTVEHNFKPNHATTSFKGVRQPRATVPIVTDAAIAMNISFKDVTSDASSSKSLKDIGGGSTSTKGITSGMISAKFLPDISNDILKLFSNPMQCIYKPNVGSNFIRNDGTTFHGGLDISPTVGMELYTSGIYTGKRKSIPVVSAYNGVVVRTGESSGFGTPPDGGIVVVRYGEDNGSKPFSDGFYYFFVYGHVNADSSIKEGTIVKTGQLLGNAVWPNKYKGDSVTNGGLHLHLQVHRQPSDKTSWVSGKEYMIVPSPFLNQKEDCITGVKDFLINQVGDSPTSGDNVSQVDTNGDWRKDTEFLNKVKNLSTKYGFNPKEFIAVLFSESGLNPKAITPGNLKLNIETCKEYCKKNGNQSNTCCKATGINQFLPNIIEQYGITTDQYYNLSRAKQMDYVEKQFDDLYNKGYFKKGQVSAGVLYGLNFLPARVKTCAGKGSDCVLTYKGETGNNGKLLGWYESNTKSTNGGLDTNKDGKITIGDLDLRVKNLVRSLEPINV